MEIVFKPIKSKEDELRVRKFSESPAGKPRDDLKWYWEFYNNSYKRLIGYMILDQEKLVGIELFIEVPLLIKGKLVKSLKSEDSYICEDYRGKGLYKKLYDFILEDLYNSDYKFIWGFTASYEVYKKIGFSDLGKSITFIRPVFKLRKLKVLLASLYSIVVSLFPKIGRKHINRSIPKNDEVKIAVSDNYYKWRIYDNPYLVNSTIMQEGEASLVIGAYDNKILASVIETGMEFDLKNLIKKTLKKYFKFDIYFHQTDFNSKYLDIRRTLLEYGFILMAKEPMHFIVKAIDPLYSQYLLDSWDVNGLWYEWGF